MVHIMDTISCIRNEVIWNAFVAIEVADLKTKAALQNDKSLNDSG